MMFELKGIVSGTIRSDEELLRVNKDEADNAFKVQLKIFSQFMKDNGFLKYKTSSYIAKIVMMFWSI